MENQPLQSPKIEAPSTLRSGNLSLRFAGAEIRRSGKSLYIPRSDDRGIPRRRIKRTVLIQLAVLFLLAFLLRFWRLDSVPPGLYIDEVSLGYNAYSILKTGKDEHGKTLPWLYEAFGEYKLPTYVYATAASLAVFGVNEFSLRFVSAFSGTLTIILVYLLTAELFPERKKTGLPFFASLFLAVSPWHLHFSHAGFEATFGLLFLVAGLLAFLQAKRGRKHCLFLASVFFLLSFYTYNSLRLFAPLLFIAAAVIFRINPLKYKRETKLSLILVVIFLLPFLSQLLNKQALVRFNTENIFHQPQPLNRFFSNYFANFDTTFLFFRGDQNGRHSVRKLGMLYVFELPLVLYGLKEILTGKSKGSKFLAAWLFLGPLPSSLTTINPHALRSLHLAPAWHLISALGLMALYRLVATRHHNIKNNVIAAFSFFAVFNIALYLHQYYVHYPNETSLDWQSGTKEAVKVIREKYDEYEVIYVTDVLYPQYLGFFLPINPTVYQQSQPFEKIGKLVYFSDLKELPLPAGNKALIVSHWWQKPEDDRKCTEIRMLNRDLAYNIWEL